MTHFSWRGAPIFRAAGSEADDPVDMAMFPLAPFANRIAHGRFEFGGRIVQLRRNFGDHPHALHGQAWQSPWTLEQVEAARARLAFAYEPGEWPWRYRCTQEIELQHDGAAFSLRIANMANEPMPVSFGFHPYFSGRLDGVVRAQVSGMWDIDPTILPTTHTAPIVDLPAGVQLSEAPFIDHCFTGWVGALTVERPKMQVAMTASREFGFLHIYAPKSGDFFCAEPVSAMPDALNRQTLADNGVRVLAPGEEIGGTMLISIGGAPLARRN